MSMYDLNVQIPFHLFFVEFILVVTFSFMDFGVKNQLQQKETTMISNECDSQITIFSAILWKYPSSRGRPKHIQPHSNDEIHTVETAAKPQKFSKIVLLFKF